MATEDIPTGPWFLWNRRTHTVVRDCFSSKAEAQRYKVGRTRGIRNSPLLSIYRTNVVPATVELLQDPANRDYFFTPSHPHE